jgi:hypothetical protein
MGIGDLVEAVAVRAAHGVGREQQQHGAVRRIGDQLLQAVLDARLPVETGMELLGVEPDGVPPLFQVITQADGQRDVLIVTVADEDALGDEGLLRHELVPAVLADVQVPLLAEDDVRLGALRAREAVSHSETPWQTKPDRLRRLARRHLKPPRCPHGLEARISVSARRVAENPPSTRSRPRRELGSAVQTLRP